MRKHKILILGLVTLSLGANAATVLSQNAAAAASAWATASGGALGERFGAAVASVDEYAVTNGYSFYVVKMQGGGVVIMSSDTAMDPVIAFSSAADVNLGEDSPLRYLLERDISARAALVSMRRRTRASAASAATQAAPVGGDAGERAWAALLGAPAASSAGRPGHMAYAAAKPVESVDDVRVAPLCKTKWSQSTDRSNRKLYNFYTPNGYPCGCTATAAAQIMKYFGWPTASMPQKSYACEVDGVGQQLTTRGGVYNWASMKDDPNVVNTETEREAIGHITYDIGAALGSEYTSSGTGANPDEIARVFRGQSFGYANAWVFSPPDTWETGIGGLHNLSARQKVIYTNLDAGRPVELAIYGYAAGHEGNPYYWAGHAVVGDGYGFKSISGVETAFVHINMGWAGTDDMWYNIPEINASQSGAHIGDKGYNFCYMGGAAFNISTNETGEIVSGRIVDADGFGIAGATVTAYKGAVAVATATSSDSGVYAFSLPGGFSYSIGATSPDGKLSAEYGEFYLSKTTGNASYVIIGESGVGNRWGCDMELSEPNVRIVGGESYTSLDKALAAASEGDTLEILARTKLKTSVTLAVSCTITATNADAAASAVAVVGGASLSVTSGARLLLDGVVFTGMPATFISVEAGSTLALSGMLGIGRVDTADSGGIELAGEIPAITSDGIFVSCAAGSSRDVKIGAWTCDAATASASAAKILCVEDPELGAVADSSGSLVWGRVPVDPLVASAYAVEADRTTYYRTLDKLFGDCTNGAEVVLLKDCAADAFKSAVAVRGDMTIRSDGGVPRTVVPGSGARFTVLPGGSLVVSNVTFSGYSGPRFVSVEGGDFTLGEGAAITGFETMTPVDVGGTIALKSGVMTMLPGSLISGCSAASAPRGANGGGVFAAGGVLDIRGGSITNCAASKFGGGVYVAKAAVARVSAAANVSGNVAGGASPAPSDIYLESSANPLVVSGLPAGGSVGVLYNYNQYAQNAVDANAMSNAFAVVDAALGEDDLDAVAKAFFNDKDSEMSAAWMVDDASGATNLIWVAKPEDDGTVPPDLAYARLIDATGAVTNYYEYAMDAFAAASEGSTIELLDDDYFDRDIAVNCALTLRTAPDAPFPTCYLSRADQCQFAIGKGGSLSVTNAIVEGAFRVYDYYYSRWVEYGGSNTLFSVKGGSLAFRDGAAAGYFKGDGARMACAVCVDDKGTFTMEGGSCIEDCGNDYEGEIYPGVFKPEMTGIGGGVLVWSGVADLRGGTISGCWATKGGGVYAKSGTSVRISGDMEIYGNTLLDKATASNLELEGDALLLTLDGSASSRVGVVRSSVSAAGDTNIFAAAELSFEDAAAVSNAATSASMFLSDANGDFGVVVTNAGGAAFLAWSAAVPESGAYTNNVGEALWLAAKGEAPPEPVPPEPPAAEDPLPALPDSPVASDVTNAVAAAELADQAVAAAILSAADPVAEYVAFKAWAGTVAGGEEAVVASAYALVSYEFGVAELFENAPTVEIGEMSVEKAVSGSVLTVSVSVKDGENAKDVASAKVKKMFVASGDLETWDLDVTVEDLTQGVGGEVQFAVGVSGDVDRAFVKLVY